MAQPSFLPVLAGWRLPVKCSLCHFSLQRRKKPSLSITGLVAPKNGPVKHWLVWLILLQTASLLLCQRSQPDKPLSLFFRPPPPEIIAFVFPQWWCLGVEQPHWKVLQSHHSVSFTFPLKNCCPHDAIKKPVIIRTIRSKRIFCTRDCKSVCLTPPPWTHRPGSGYFGPTITCYST